MTIRQAFSNFKTDCSALKDQFSSIIISKEPLSDKEAWDIALRVGSICLKAIACVTGALSAVCAFASGQSFADGEVGSGLVLAGLSVLGGFITYDTLVIAENIRPTSTNKAKSGIKGFCRFLKVTFYDRQETSFKFETIKSIFDGTCLTKPVVSFYHWTFSLFSS